MLTSSSPNSISLVMKWNGLTTLAFSDISFVGCCAVERKKHIYIYIYILWNFFNRFIYIHTEKLYANLTNTLDKKID